MSEPKKHIVELSNTELEELLGAIEIYIDEQHKINEWAVFPVLNRLQKLFETLRAGSK